MRYLDPKNDLVFKKVFGEHANILVSLLNALLPLRSDQVIQSIEYLPSELVPEIPIIKNSIVDVRCIDNLGQQFIVEMQMLWTDSFTSRVLFNASKAYIRQLDKGIEYKGLKPVYALSLVNEIFDSNPDLFYHHYRLVHAHDDTKVIDGLQLVFVEIPKFKLKKFAEKKILVLWLRYLSEIENGQDMLDEQLLKELNSVPEIAQALELSKESAYSKEQLAAYDKYWDNIRTERTFIADAEEKGMAIGEERGIAIGEERGIAIGEERGIARSKESIILKGFDNGLLAPMLATLTSHSEDDVIKILKKHGKL
jgi:predicted transposase/invertase (TIGR01784 family)